MSSSGSNIVTTDPSLRSFVEYDETCEFPIQNLPYGVFKLTKDNGELGDAHIGVAIGDHVLDLNVLASKGKLDGVLSDPSVFQQPALNEFMALGRKDWSAVRAFLTELLAEGSSLADDMELRSEVLFPLDQVQMQLPANIGDYTDFYSSKEHATNLGTMFRPNEEPLKPNWVHLPVGYHGRASSVVTSGTAIKRPHGQLKPAEGAPTFGVCKLMDIELEMGFFVGPGNDLGDPIRIGEAEEHIFGMVLMNDWSARDIQKWEYVPLGPFGGKNLGTTISPWVVTMEALEPFRVAAPKQDPEVLDYLNPGAEAKDTYDINLSVQLATESMLKDGKPHQEVATSNFKYMYWSMKQQLVQHSVTGCNMRPGDLCGSGTISGPEDSERGSFLELCWKGTQPFAVGDEERKFLQDNDSVMLRGWCQGEGFRVGFGECEGTILPAVEY